MNILSDIEEKLLNDKYTIVLKEDSGRIKYKNNKVILLLSNEYVHIIDYNNFINKKLIKEIKKVELEGIIGSNYEFKNRNDKHFTMKIFSYNYDKKSSMFKSSNENRRKREILSVDFINVSQNICDIWKNAIYHMAYNNYSDKCIYNHDPSEIELALDTNAEIFDNKQFQTPPNRKRYIVFVNPVSGSGIAQKIWKKKVLPIFKEAGVEYLEVITSYANHAKNCMYNGKVDSSFINSNVNLFEYYDVIVTIGGDGLICEIINGIMDRTDGLEILKKVWIAPINGGTGNGLVKSVLFSNHEEYTIINSTINALKGKGSPMDISEVNTSTLKKYHSFLSLSWGLVSDIDILSEKMRSMGELRLYIAAVYFILKRKFYKGRLSIYTGNKDNFSIDKVPPLNVPIGNSNDWKVIESNFSLVWVLQTSHDSGTMLSGPGKRLDDGEFMILVVKNISRLGLLELLLTFDTGGHVNHPSVQVFKTVAYRLEPLCQDGIFSLDGEKIEYNPVQSIIHNGIANICTKK